jgi:hypothetical protein
VPVNPWTTSTPTREPATCDHASHPAITSAVDVPLFIPRFYQQGDAPDQRISSCSSGWWAVITATKASTTSGSNCPVRPEVTNLADSIRDQLRL